ncbi:hypothetical protein [Hymenobacter psychrophilus]|uniref:Outer membrane protein beta-barrel domain-containing protein n=1 Tax=Hymenobacter psychrophilus TaxID=651662 RepID=A0A1H3JIU0_9BACT|nr:hypothetical protein [Hymenobacter psychrophilus]SDY39832.1 hypothetical protein SAMN04488069_108101 [Hymenobacter psychrophilus]
MRFFSLTVAGLATAALLSASVSALAQQATLASPPTPPTEVPAAPAPVAAVDAAVRPRPLFKLGTGLADGAGLGGYTGLNLPLVLGVEQQLAPGWSATLNGSSLWNIGQRRYYGTSNREGLNLRQLGLDVGIRHYYHQEKRQAAGRRTGPYQGPYVALQLGNYFRRDLLYYYTYSRHELAYDYSTLTVRWGVQRRLGSRGLLNAYIGGGLANPRTYHNYIGAMPEYRRDLSLGLEVGVKISLTNK